MFSGPKETNITQLFLGDLFNSEHPNMVVVVYNYIEEFIKISSLSPLWKLLYDRMLDSVNFQIQYSALIQY